MKKPYFMILSEKITPDSQRGDGSAGTESQEPHDMGSTINLPRGHLRQATKHFSVLVSSSVKGE